MPGAILHHAWLLTYLQLVHMCVQVRCQHMQSISTYIYLQEVFTCRKCTCVGSGYMRRITACRGCCIRACMRSNSQFCAVGCCNSSHRTSKQGKVTFTKTTCGGNGGARGRATPGPAYSRQGGVRASSPPPQDGKAASDISPL